MNRSVTVMVTVDVEDWFHSENLRRVVPPPKWPSMELRVQGNTERLLSLFNELGIKATFFILGWVAERLPDLARRIEAEGHEVASHGYGHERIPHLSREAFLEDVRKAKGILEDQVGKPVLVGYRAPCFSITDEAADVLLEAGYTYDSSLFRVSLHDRYGSLSLPGEPLSRAALLRLANGLYEFPVSIVELGSLRLPWAGGISGCCRIPFSSEVSGESLPGSGVSCFISIRGRSTPNSRGLIPDGS